MQKNIYIFLLFAILYIFKRKAWYDNFKLINNYKRKSKETLLFSYFIFILIYNFKYYIYMYI